MLGSDKKNAKNNASSSDIMTLYVSGLPSQVSDTYLASERCLIVRRHWELYNTRERYIYQTLCMPTQIFQHLLRPTVNSDKCIIYGNIYKSIIHVYSQVAQARYMSSSMWTFALLRDSSDLHIYKDLYGERNKPEKKGKITVELQ